MEGIWIKVFVHLYLLMPLVAIPATLLRELEGHAIFLTSGGLHNGLASLDALTGGALLVSLSPQGYGHMWGLVWEVAWCATS